MKKYTPIIAAILALLLLAGGLYWYSYHVGVKEKIDRTVDAVAILEDGRELDCTVRFLGTLYVDHPSTEIDQFHGDYDGGIWINDHMVLNSYSFERTDEHGIMNGQYYLSLDMSLLPQRSTQQTFSPIWNPRRSMSSSKATPRRSIPPSWSF